MALPHCAICAFSVSGCWVCNWTDQYRLRLVADVCQLMTADSFEDAHSPVMSAYTWTVWLWPSMALTVTGSRVNGPDSRIRSPGSVGDSHSATSSTPPACRVKTERVAVT